MTKTRSNKKQTRHGITKRQKVDGYWFDYSEADRAIRFIEKNLTHIEGKFAGQPLILEPWQRTIVEDLFGWKNESDNLRKYRVLYFEVPRKNGKSTLGAAIALYLLFADREYGAQIVSAASDTEQAKLIFTMASKMIQNSSKLSELSSVFAKSIAYYRLGNTYKVLSADARGKHGRNLHGIIFDEVHEQPNRELYDTLKTSMGTRLQPLEVYMTTAGYDRTSICWELHEYAEKVKAGIVNDPTFYPVIYSAPYDADWTDEKVWKQANPNLGISVRLEFLRNECRRAKETPAYENTFRRLYLNQWTEQDSRMIPMHIWVQNGKEPFTEESMNGRECWGGLDLASTQDVGAFSLIFPWLEGYRALSYFFCPRDNMPARHKKNPMANYPEWAKQGHLIATDGNQIDYDFIERFILGKQKVFNIKKIGYDRWNATQLVKKLEGHGLNMEPFGMGFASLSAPTKELLRALEVRKFHHNNHPVFSWMAGNVASEQNAEGSIKPSKRKSKEKIDGIISAVVGIGLYISEDVARKSVYEERGLITF